MAEKVKLCPGYLSVGCGKPRMFRQGYCSACHRKANESSRVRRRIVDRVQKLLCEQLLHLRPIAKTTCWGCNITGSCILVHTEEGQVHLCTDRCLSEEALAKWRK